MAQVAAQDSVEGFQMTRSISPEAVSSRPKRGRPPLSIKERILRSISVSDNGCWIWNRSKFFNGYGLIRIHTKGRKSHRVSYEAFRGPIPEGMQIDHLCRGRICCNPDHLEAVTPIENWRRSNSPSNLNREKTHCLRGHEFTPENASILKSSRLDGHSYRV